MSEFKYTCFVIMPFLPELHYFYLYLKYHIEKQHSIRCERGDSRILTSLLLDKIIDYIKDADLIIADCSGRNPNVFYELGIAQALGKEVILITRDAISEVPTDIKGFEFIKYELDKDIEFLSKLDNALSNIFVERYVNLYKRAEVIYNDFRIATRAPVEKVSEEVFASRVKDAERTLKIPSVHEDNTLNLAAFVLPRIIVDTTDIAIMEQLNTWLFEKLKLSS
jgi:hypothetical protein